MATGTMTQTTPGDQLRDLFRRVDELIAQSKAEINQCCELELEHHARLNEAKARREFVETRALDALRSMHDPAAFALVTARQFGEAPPVTTPTVARPAPKARPKRLRTRAEAKTAEVAAIAPGTPDEGVGKGAAS